MTGNGPFRQAPWASSPPPTWAPAGPAPAAGAGCRRLLRRWVPRQGSATAAAWPRTAQSAPPAQPCPPAAGEEGHQQRRPNYGSGPGFGSEPYKSTMACCSWAQPQAKSASPTAAIIHPQPGLSVSPWSAAARRGHHQWHPTGCPAAALPQAPAAWRAASACSPWPPAATPAPPAARGTPPAAPPAPACWAATPRRPAGACRRPGEAGTRGKQAGKGARGVGVARAWRPAKPSTAQTGAPLHPPVNVPSLGPAQLHAGAGQQLRRPGAATAAAGCNAAAEERLPRHKC